MLKNKPLKISVISMLILIILSVSVLAQAEEKTISILDEDLGVIEISMREADLIDQISSFFNLFAITITPTQPKPGDVISIKAFEAIPDNNGINKATLSIIVKATGFRKDINVTNLIPCRSGPGCSMVATVSYQLPTSHSGSSEVQLNIYDGSALPFFTDKVGFTISANTATFCPAPSTTSWRFLFNTQNGKVEQREITTYSGSPPNCVSTVTAQTRTVCNTGFELDATRSRCVSSAGVTVQAGVPTDSATIGDSTTPSGTTGDTTLVKGISRTVVIISIAALAIILIWFFFLRKKR